ncbi:hypothetical protein N7490_005769 [Penicillium lividum]|nr:hypothetical protein N7490_005769 [Penicillium lividum]
MPSLPQDLLDGISGALAAEGDILQMVLVTFIGLSCYNVAELVVLVTATFRRWRGLYFWSLLTSGCLGVLTGFTIQESLISTLYVIHTIKLLRLGADATSRSDSRTIMYHVIGINCAIMAMDLLLLSLEYANQYAVQIVLKGFIYSIKLKLEFAVLGRLVDIIQGSRHPISVAIADTLPLCSYPRPPETDISEQPDPEPEESEPKEIAPAGKVAETRDFAESEMERPNHDIMDIM